jgi:hypothetical protein
MTVPRAKFGLSDATFSQRLAETIVWCSALVLIGDPDEDANAIQHRDMSRRAAELLSLAYKADPSLYAQRNWNWRWMNWSKIRRASKMKAEAERLFAIADHGSIEPPLRQQLRNSEFRPWAAPLFQPGENRTELVEALAEKRASLLREMSVFPAVSSDGAGGRLLVYEPDFNVEDGASEYMSKGYFDERDAPPWDTWVCYFDCQLISWVPPCLLDLVQAGIAANPVDCIRWLENAALPAEDGC